MTDHAAPDHRYTVQDLYTLEFHVDDDGIARWTGRLIPFRELVMKAPGPAVADLIAILTDPEYDP